MDFYDDYASPEEERAALIQALQRRAGIAENSPSDFNRAWGNLALASGDRVLSNFGQAQLADARQADTSGAQLLRALAAKKAPAPVDPLVSEGRRLSNALKERKLAGGGGGDAGKPPKMTQGQKALDSAFAKDFNEWETTGRGAFNKNMTLLNDALQRLVKAKDDAFGPTGRTMGRLPDWMRSQESIAIRDDVRRAVQGSLRATLGSQFTAEEGQRIMDQAYNETLSPAENIKRIQTTMQELADNARNMQGRATYFNEHDGTLQGMGPSVTSAQESGGLSADQQKRLEELRAKKKAGMLK